MKSDVAGGDLDVWGDLAPGGSCEFNFESKLLTDKFSAHDFTWKKFAV